jgi:hypothetical protein
MNPIDDLLQRRGIKIRPATSIEEIIYEKQQLIGVQKGIRTELELVAEDIDLLQRRGRIVAIKFFTLREHDERNTPYIEITISPQLFTKTKICESNCLR